MRASRVIGMLIALQQRGAMTAAQLAAELEVSERTVLRDVETLSAAGIPVYAVRGSGGGIRLLSGFASQLTALTADDASGLLLAGQLELAATLGVGAAASSARRSLLSALPEALASSATSIDTWFLHDPAGPHGLPFDPLLLRVTVRAVQQHVEMHAETGPALQPLGVVLEAGDWQLVHLAGVPSVTPFADLRGPYALGRSFIRPSHFDLKEFWRTRAANAY